MTRTEYVCKVPGHQFPADDSPRQWLSSQSLIVYNSPEETKGKMALRRFNTIRIEKGYLPLVRMPKGTRYYRLSEQTSKLLRQCNEVLPKLFTLISHMTGIWALDVYYDVPMVIFMGDGMKNAKFVVEGEYWYCVYNECLNRQGFSVPTRDYHFTLPCSHVKVHYTEVHKYLKVYMDNPEIAKNLLKQGTTARRAHLSYIGHDSPTIFYEHGVEDFDKHREQYLKNQEYYTAKAKETKEAETTVNS